MQVLKLVLFLICFGIYSETKISTDKVFLSPNHDGINDFILFKIDSNLDKISDFSLSITDESNRIVKLIQADKRRQNKKSFLTSWLVKENEFVGLEIYLPKELIWYGTDNLGKPIPDGRYNYQLKIIDLNKKEFSSEVVTIYVDTISPYAKLFSENKYFTPNNDKVWDSVNIKQDLISENSDRWFGSIVNDSGLIVKTYTWDTRTIPKILSWDGKDDRGILQKEGVYTYTLKGEDFSENSFSISLENIYLSRSNNNFDVQTNISSFSPDNDKLKDTVEFKILNGEKNIQNWKLEIYILDKEKKEIIKSFFGNSTPHILLWDGKNDKGKLLSDGIYFYNAKFNLGKNEVESSLKKIEINTVNKQIEFLISPKEFTPDSNFDNDILEIFPKVENLKIKTWKISILQNYKVGGVSKKIIFKKFRGIGQPNKIFWEGFSDKGILIHSNADLEIIFSFRNELDQLKFYKVKEFKTGVMVNFHQNKLRVSIPESIFSKDQSNYISEFKSIIKKFPGYKVEIQSHSKQSGDNLQNMKKTENRAKFIYKEIFGIEKDFGRYTYRGFGEVEPFFTADNDYLQERNDRVDLLFFLPKTISQ